MRQVVCDWLLKKFKRVTACVLLSGFFCLYVVAQGGHYSWDFADCDLKDILFAVSMDTGIAIVPDDTVCGNGDFRFAGENFDDAFEAFLTRNRLFVERSEKVWMVSKFAFKIDTEKQGEKPLFCVDACDLLPGQILEKLSEKTGKVMTFDVLPVQKISVHLKSVSEEELVQTLARLFGNFEVAFESKGYHFRKKMDSTDLKRQAGNDGLCKIEYVDLHDFLQSESRILVDIKDCSFSEALEELFNVERVNNEGLSFCMIFSGDVRLQRTVFYGVDFADTLQKLCAQAGFSYVNNDSIYYIFSDRNSRDELICGKRQWSKFSLRYTNAQDFLSLLSKKLEKPEVVVLPDEFSFLCKVSEEEGKMIDCLIEDVDIKKSTYLISLKYIKPKELLEYLPPNIDKNALSLADDSESLYFKGTEEAYKILCEQLKLCDRPVKRLSYDLLILQYDETMQNSWSSALDAKRLTAGNRNSLSAMLGSVMGFNLNVVTAFGLSFAAELQNSIEENATKVYADTTLHGISGKPISFQNTNTYRYRDNNVNPETGVPLYSGITKEISSGIKLDILGWVSGEGAITSKVTASVSRQGVDTSSSTGNPPPTSEKIVTTEVCGKSGEPVVLSGLVQQSDSNQQKRTPLLSKIPVLGNLFKNKDVNREKFQMIIYLVPHVENDNREQNDTNVMRQRFDECWREQKMQELEQLRQSCRKLEA